MARRLALAAVGGLLVFAAPAQAGISPSEALTILNQWKTQAHEPKVASMDPAWNDGCEKHDNYMAQPGHGLTHDEQPGEPGYTSEGAQAGARSVLAEPEGTPRIWEGSVYHRMGILSPRMTKSGWAASYGFTCMRTIDTLRNGVAGEPVITYPWPPDGAANVPTAFTDNEYPNPHALVPGPLGYLLSVNIGGPWYGNYATEVRVAHASLKTAAGTPVTVTKVDTETEGGGVAPPYKIGDYLNDDLAIFPHGYLHAQTTYVAHADGTVTYGSDVYPFSVTWRFKTGGTLAKGKTSLALSKGRVDGRKVKFTLTASKSLVGRRATKTVNGKKPVTITLSRTQTVKAPKPAKGRSVTVKVATRKFVREGVSYPAASAKRTFTRH